MKRTRGLRRTGFKRKATKPPRPTSKPRDLAGEYELKTYREGHDRCAICHWPRERMGRWLELHHIMGRGRGGKYAPENFLMVCMDDHRGYHDGGSRSLKLGHILTAKREEDGAVDLEFLAWIRHKAPTALVPEPLPAWVIEERKRNAAWRS